MPSAPSSEPADRDGQDALAASIQSVEQALDEIDRTLHQMLLLAELSASDCCVDREGMQRVLQRLRQRIDRIADRISDL